MKMQESILKRVYKMEQKHNISYARKDGKAYSCCRALFFVFAAWAAFFAVILTMGMLIDRGAFEAGSSEYILITQKMVGSLCIALLLAVGAVFNALKKPVFTFVPSVAVGVYGIVFFALAINFDPNMFLGLPFKYYWAHLIPLIGVMICSIVMFVIGVRQWAILRKEYKNVSERLYEEYRASADELDEEQWENFLNNYTPNSYKKQFKKHNKE